MSAALWIMRHGEAAPGSPDAQRELTAHGREEVARMADWLASTLDGSQHGELRVAVSPYRRARQTAEIVAERLDRPVEVLERFTPNDPLEPVVDWESAFVRELRHFHRCIVDGIPCRTPIASARDDVALIVDIIQCYTL